MSDEFRIIKTIKKVLPGVVSIVISKYLTEEKTFPPEFPNLSMLFSGDLKKKKVKIAGGSGFIVDKSGIVLTNRHVVVDPKAEYAVILNDKRKFKAEIIARDRINDVAILKIPADNLPYLELGDSSSLNLGQTVIAIGNTLGSFENTVSVGVISGLSRRIKTIDLIEKSSQNLKGLIQTDAAINPGNSGGPLVNLEAKVIGINCAMIFGAENIGFAIPSNAAEKDLEDLRKYGKIREPFLGVRYISINKELQEEYGIPVNYGALIISEGIPEREAIVPNSPAHKAGLQETDIILEIENKKITPENPLQEILQEFNVGDEIQLKILRKNKEIILKTVLSDKK